MSLRLTPPEPPPEFLYEPPPKSQAKGRRWVVSGLVVLLAGAGLAGGVFVVHGYKDTLFGPGALVPVIAPQERPLKHRADSPAPRITTPESPRSENGQAATTERPPTPSETLRAIVAGTPAAEPEDAAGPKTVATLPTPQVPAPPALPENVDAAARPAAAVEADTPTALPATTNQEVTAEPEAFAIEVIPATTIDAAKREWSRLQQVYPALLGDTSLELRRVTLEDDRVLFRGLVGRLPSRSTAEDFCAQLTVLDQNQDCRVLPRPSRTQLAARPPATAPAPALENAAPAVAVEQPAESEADPNLVRLIKFALKRSGFDPGPLDSRVTPELTASIKAYQQRNGLDGDGKPSRPLLNHMLGAPVAKIESVQSRPVQRAAQPEPETRQETPRPAPLAEAVTVSQLPSPESEQADPAVTSIEAKPNEIASTPPRIQSARTDTARVKLPKAAPQSSTSSSVTEPEWYITRGDDMLKLGDIISARLFYEEAVGLGSAKAKKALAQTFDPIFFANTGVRGPRPDAKKAVTLYSEAAQAGDRDAENRLNLLQAWLAQSGQTGN